MPPCPTEAGETRGRGDGVFARGPFLSGERKGPLALPSKESRVFLREGSSFRRKKNPLALSRRKPHGISCSGARRARWNGETLRQRKPCFFARGDFFQEKEEPSRALPKKAAWDFLFRRAEGALERRNAAAEKAVFFCERVLLSGERRTLSRSPEESHMGFPVPARGERAGTEKRCGDEEPAAPAPPSAGRTRQSGFLGKGVLGEGDSFF